jgi:hypothetical protein
LAFLFLGDGMEIGSREWILDLANKLALDCQPQLLEIIDDASNKHGIDRVCCSQADGVRIACLIGEVQAESFRLGLRIAMELAGRLASLQHEGQKGS